MKDYLYYKRNVPYTVVVRRHSTDTQGYALNTTTPWISIEAETLRDFKLANKRFIIDGIIVPSEVPSTDWETPNALSDEDITELLKNYMKLKNTLHVLDSIPTLFRLLDAAKDQDKSEKTKRLIKVRLEELGEEFDEPTPAEMRGAK